MKGCSVICATLVVLTCSSAYAGNYAPISRYEVHTIASGTAPDALDAAPATFGTDAGVATTTHYAFTKTQAEVSPGPCANNEDSATDAYASISMTYHKSWQWQANGGNYTTDPAPTGYTHADVDVSGSVEVGGGVGDTAQASFSFNANDDAVDGQTSIVAYIDTQGNIHNDSVNTSDSYTSNGIPPAADHVIDDVTFGLGQSSDAYVGDCKDNGPSAYAAGPDTTAVWNYLELTRFTCAPTDATVDVPNGDGP